MHEWWNVEIRKLCENLSNLLSSLFSVLFIFILSNSFVLPCLSNELRVANHIIFVCLCCRTLFYV